MMQISFILTTYNIEKYIKQCLDSIKPCLKPGDQVIIVDDASTDTTPDIINAEISNESMGRGVEVTPVFLGVNTAGGVGIPGNIGMDKADREAIFFVDGDDFIEVDGFKKARKAFEENPTDIMLCNYVEHDEKNNTKKHPADKHKWEGINPNWTSEDSRLKAFDLIAVPWRKFYLSSLLDKHQIRFPEGDFFFEDNPFHWRVCRLANSISFFDEVICHHRVNRPGQTMTSTGGELSAFFTHFETIFSEIPETADEQRELACKWLLNNMTWHLDRLKPAALWGYGMVASQTLSKIPDNIWDGQLCDFFMNKNIWPIVYRLRQGGVWDVIESVKAKQRYSELRSMLSGVQQMAKDTKKARELLQAKQYIDEYVALLDIEVPPPKK